MILKRLLIAKATETHFILTRRFTPCRALSSFLISKKKMAIVMAKLYKGV